MKQYSKPTLEIQVLHSEDIMALSTENKFLGLGSNDDYTGDRVDFSEYLNS